MAETNLGSAASWIMIAAGMLTRGAISGTPESDASRQALAGLKLLEEEIRRLDGVNRDLQDRLDNTPRATAQVAEPGVADPPGVPARPRVSGARKPGAAVGSPPAQSLTVQGGSTGEGGAT